MIFLRRHGLECYDVIVFGVAVLVDLTSTDVQAMVAALCSGPRELHGPGDALTEAENRASAVRQAVCDGTVRMTSNRSACRCRVNQSLLAVAKAVVAEHSPDEQSIPGGEHCPWCAISKQAAAASASAEVSRG